MSSGVRVDPAALVAAGRDVSVIGYAVADANSAAAASTTSVVPAGADEVSVAIAAVFSSHGAAYQSLGAQADQWQAQFAQLLAAAGAAYQAEEALLARDLSWNFNNPLVETVEFL